MQRSKEKKLSSFAKLLEILDTLRKECPWDRKQTNESLRPNTIEEVYELSDALLTANTSEIRKELGDVLLHILFYAKIAEEQRAFDFSEVCDTLVEKLIYRHPHIFGDTKVEDEHEVESNWEQLKLKERGGNKTVLSGVPKSLPSIIKAYRIQDKARNVGFDWEKKEDVLDKVKEEFSEVELELKKSQLSTSDLEAEMGDLLFSVINMARLWGINPDNALEKTNAKFISRFTYLEQRAKANGKNLKDMPLEEMDAIWDEAKTMER